MTKLKVLSRNIGLANLRSTFMVEYEGNQYKVRMFDFQENEPIPETIDCDITASKISQKMSTLFDKFYPNKDEHYLFKVKTKWQEGKYYEIEDPRIHARIEKDRIYHKLLFSESSPDLEEGQSIMCSIKEQKEKKLILHLEDDNISLVEFKELTEVFDENNEALFTWIKDAFEADFMAETKRVYDEEDGRWIFFFSREIEPLIYHLMQTKKEVWDSLLPVFCTSWLDMVERSPFIAKMSKHEAETFRGDLTRSIEISEDFLDALNEPDKKRKILENISSLDPKFYQFRIERRFRFLSCAFGKNPKDLESSIHNLLEKLRTMDKNIWGEGSVALALMYILKLYVNNTKEDLLYQLSLDSETTIIIKRCVLSLCYLTRIMHHRNDKETPLYTSLTYQLLSLLNIPKDEKLRLLKNSSSALLSDSYPLPSCRWEKLEDMVMNQSYAFGMDDISTEANKHLTFSNENTLLSITQSRISLSPITQEKANMADLPLPNDQIVSLSYGKSLTTLKSEVDFIKVQNIWNSIEDSVFSPAKIIKEKNVLVDGDRVDIYITEIIDSERARCKTVGFDENDEEGEIYFNNLFFYNRPKITIENFLGSDYSPLIFPAIYHISGGKVTFDANIFKPNYANDMIPRRLVTCLVISKRGYSCIGITSNGLMLHFNTKDEGVGLQTFVDVYVTGVNGGGYGEAMFSDISKDTFIKGRAYANYIKEFNDYWYEGEETLSSMNYRRKMEKTPTLLKESIEVSPSLVEMLENIIYMVSNLETNLRSRYGCLSICGMLSRLIKDERSMKMYDIRKKYTKMLYVFSLNNQLLDSDIEQFLKDIEGRANIKEVSQEWNVISILGKFGKTFYDSLDKTLISFLTTESTPLEKELSRLVLSSGMLTNFKNRAIEDHLLDELAKILGIDIVKKEVISIGLEESQTVEFKTSIVYPPNNKGNEDIEQQSDNIIRVIASMMNSEGGALYIGVNDLGNIVGLRDDLAYFSRKRGHHDEIKARDDFKNHFSYLLTSRFGSDVAKKFTFDFEEREGYFIFKVDIPKHQVQDYDYIRVGTTCQKR